MPDSSVMKNSEMNEFLETRVETLLKSKHSEPDHHAAGNVLLQQTKNHEGLHMMPETELWMKDIDMDDWKAAASVLELLEEKKNDVNAVTTLGQTVLIQNKVAFA